jgi:hypothetical protein
MHHRIRQNVLTLRRKVDECKPLIKGHVGVEAYDTHPQEFNEQLVRLSALAMLSNGRAGGVVRTALKLKNEQLEAGAYTRPFFGSTQAQFVGYVGCMIPPQVITQGPT